MFGGVLVVIGVGRTDHLNTRHCNHDRALSLFLTHFLAAVLPAGLTLLARRTVIALPHPPPPRSSSSRPDARGCPGNTSRLLPPVSVLPFVSIVAWPVLLDENGIVPSIQIEVREIYRREHGDVYFRSNSLHLLSRSLFDYNNSIKILLIYIIFML